MKALALILFLVTGLSGTTRLYNKCPENEIYHECGSSLCPSEDCGTQYQLCTMDCSPELAGCRCKSGYRRDLKRRVCIPQDECLKYIYV
ncbi:hypothetical protein ILUMI_05047 [Ignelater luminosus]|uniref:TIL domain-containing protein n=1 Tax=Ignelater luminosus TaxID=2038154 RepID=A0A8K0GIH1_IGNLU|nr:hypothetical protein ILUMI_05047 [Ignelater luminosus]